MDNKPKPGIFRKTIGQSGTRIHSGIITGEEHNQLLVGRNGIKVFEIMRRSDETIRSTLQVVKLPVRQVSWDIEPASDDEQDQFNARFTKHQLFEKIDWDKFLKEALTELDFGYSLFEETFGLDEFENKTVIGIKDLGWRKQTTILSWEMEDKKPGVTQQLPGGGNVSIPREKLMVFTHDQEGDNWEGVSLLRYAYKAWDFKNRFEIMNAIGMERQSVGVPVGELPPDSSETEKQKFEEALYEFRVNDQGYIIKPSGFGIEMLDMKASSTRDPIPSIQYYVRQIQLSVLAQFLALGGSDASGSRAVSEDHSKLFLMSEEALAKQIQSVIQKQLIEPLCNLNFSNMKNGYPKLTFGKIGDDNVERIGNFVNQLFNAGAITYNPETENHLRKLARLPELTEEQMEQIEREKEEMKQALKEKSDETEKKTKPTTDVKDQDKKDLEVSAALKAAREARERLIGALPGA